VGGWSLSQLSLGERRGTTWTGRQSITGPHRDKQDKQPCTLTLAPRDNLESPINLTCVFLDGGRKPEYPERTHTSTGRTCKLHTEKNTPKNFVSFSLSSIVFLVLFSLFIVDISSDHQGSHLINKPCCCNILLFQFVNPATHRVPPPIPDLASSQVQRPPLLYHISTFLLPLQACWAPNGSPSLIILLT